MIFHEGLPYILVIIYIYTLLYLYVAKIIISLFSAPFYSKFSPPLLFQFIIWQSDFLCCVHAFTSKNGLNSAFLTIFSKILHYRPFSLFTGLSPYTISTTLLGHPCLAYPSLFLQLFFICQNVF